MNRAATLARAMAAAAALATLTACGGAPAGGHAPAPALAPTTIPVAAVPGRAGEGQTNTPALDSSAAAPHAAPEAATREPDPARIENAPRHRAKVLAGPARPSRLAPGAYGCRIDAGYKFRPCTVRKDDQGFTWIDMPGSLLGLTAVVYDEGASLVLDGTSSDARPFGCFSCQERCTTDPSSCVCQELAPEASRECLLQPLTTRLTRSGELWRGTIRAVGYFNHYEGSGAGRHVSGWDTRPGTYLVEIAPAKVLAPRPPTKEECKKTECL